MNGDNIATVYQDLSFSRFFSAMVFMYCYTFFAICVVTNIFIIVVEEGYITAKYYGKEEQLALKLMKSKQPVTDFHEFKR